jgi:Zn-dependent peptidase ImmA (M78 family)/DNA-binding XRE family transcriptional regulator
MTMGARLKLARAKAQMSMRSLAKQAGISAMSVSKFERDEMVPRQSTLLKLAKVLSVQPEYFFRETKVDVLEPAYRKKSRLSKRSQKAIEAEIIDQLERYLTIEEILLQQNGDYPTFPSFAVREMEQIECASETLRHQWNLGFDPIENLAGRLEDHGVKVIALRAFEKFDGFSCWANGKVPVIAFNQDLPGDRQRFTVAHELGHLVLTTQGDHDQEKAAHRFAAAFLVPRTAAFAKLGAKRSNLDFEELKMLKREFGMSIQAWVRRAYDLGIIDSSTYQRTFKRIGALGWRIHEPNDLPALRPQRLKFLVHQALAEELITPSYASLLMGEELPTSTREITQTALSQAAKSLAAFYATDPELIEFTEADLLDDVTAKNS